VAESRDGRIWNRAVLNSGGPTPRPGDVALAALMRFHGLAMNGGVEHALEVLSHRELDAAIAGFEHFDMAEVASVLAALRSSTSNEKELDMLQERYGALVPSDSVLTAAFRVRLAAFPDDFAPI
jgi:hypothetical protein